MRSWARTLADDLARASGAPGDDLAAAALLVARVEQPNLDPTPYLAQLRDLGVEARRTVADAGGRDAPFGMRVNALNRFVFEVQAFKGNRERYDDPSNSCLNAVIDRRLGIPITLSVVYIEIARAAGFAAEGINFPGHFLARVLDGGEDKGPGLIVDPFHAGALLDEQDCRRLLRGSLGDDAAFDARLLAPVARRDILRRMVTNLKRLYVRMRSFPQARIATDLLVALSPASLPELRDRGLLAYHMNDYTAALHDLEQYLRLFRPTDDDEEQKETQQLWEHVKALRRRIASFN